MLTDNIKRIFVAGKSGQVAQSLLEQEDSFDMEINTFGRPDFDLLDNGSLETVIHDFKPDAIINAAAYTAVDKAEEDVETAHLINEKGPAFLAKVADDLDIPFLHISTDYVFNGDLARAYHESDTTGPTGAYGRSKLAGEVAVMAANPNAMIFRTAWVYSPFGHNFLKTMLRLAETRDELGVVADQVGNPTYALDIAHGLLSVLARIEDTGWKDDYSGIYHMVGTGEASWHAFAKTIFDAAGVHGHKKPVVNAITTADFPTPAKRPANSRLNTDKLAVKFGVRLPDWRKSTADCVIRVIDTK